MLLVSRLFFDRGALFIPLYERRNDITPKRVAPAAVGPGKRGLRGGGGVAGAVAKVERRDDVLEEAVALGALQRCQGRLSRGGGGARRALVVVIVGEPSRKTHRGG